MKSILLLFALILPCAATELVAAEPTSLADEKAKPNILFIFADDQMWDSIGAFENCPVETPNIDRLAKQGVRFSHAYNMGSYSPAVCLASRTMLNTGGFVWNAYSFSPDSRKAKTKYMGLHGITHRKPEGYWSQWMKQAGYETYFTGKWHVPGAEANSLFDHVSHVRPGMPNDAKGQYSRSFTPGQPDGWTYDKTEGGYWEGGTHWSEVLATDSEAFLKQAATSDKPFFMYLAFNAPHDPRQAPKEFLDRYDVDEVEVPANFLPEYPYSNYAGSGRGLRDEKTAPFPRTEHSIQVTRQEYFALITHMDVQIGRILDALEATGKADNTYIFFTADHGLAVGDHGFVGKQNMYDSSMRVPFIMTGPGLEAGKTVDAQIYMQDAMATTLEIAGVEKPAQVEFNSLLPLATGKTNTSAYGDGIYGAYLVKQRMLRTNRYKLIIYPTANMVRLYDIVNDPHEMNDLASGQPRPVELLKTLFKQFQTLKKEMKDPLDVSEAFQNFLNDVPPPPIKKSKKKTTESMTH